MFNLSRLAKAKKTIREHTDELLEKAEILYKLNYIDEKNYLLVKLACEYHDYGKMNDEFNKRVSSNRRLKFNENKEVAHNVLSLCFIDKKEFECKMDYYKVSYAILNHHHHVNNFEEIEKKKDLIEDFANKFGGKKIKSRIIDELYDLKEDKEAQLIKGLLHKCDYAASGEYEIEYINDFLLDGLSDLLEEWKKKDKNAKWNELQKFCKKNMDKNIMIVANTGMGKTEAGLLWIGNNKGFFILPLRTAINAIYTRVIENIVKDKIDKRVALLHSESLAYYLKEKVSGEEEILDYSKRGKQLSMPLTISTLDQIFNFVYKYNGFETKLATLSYSKIVIDEIQAYSPDLLAYLVLGLEKVVEFGGKFAILTATLAPFVRDYINENIKDIEFSKFTNGKDRHNVEVIEQEIDVEFIYKHYKGKGGKVLIVCNTVKKAQEIYSELEEMDENIEIKLLHAKFIKKDRAEKENEILEFGKTDVVVDGIWIATSLVEASLDIDFDYLFTELNDLNGFFQRLGRVNRKGEKESMLNEVNAYVFTEIKKGLLLNENRTSGFIDKKIYELSKEALLNEVDGILSEKDKNEILEKYLTTDNIKNSSFDSYYRDVKKYTDELYIGEEDIESVNKNFRNIISFDVIPEPIYKDRRKLIDEKLLILKEKYIEDNLKTEKENNIEKDKLRIRKSIAREEIKDFTVSVGMYDLNKGDSIDIGYEKIDIVKCKYSKEKGFERIKIEKQKEDSFDNFV